MFTRPQRAELTPPVYGHEWVFGRRGYRMTQGRMQTPYGLCPARSDRDRFLLLQPQLAITGKRVFEGGMAGKNLIDSHPPPSTGIHDTCLADDTFGKAVFAEAQDLLVDLPRELFVVAVLAHAVDQPPLEGLQAALALPRCHRAAQLVGFARREVSRHHRQL